MATIKYTAKKWQVKLRDLTNSFIIGVLTPSIYAMVEFLSHGSFDFSAGAWKQIGIIGATAFIANLARKFLEPTKHIQVTHVEDGVLLKAGTPPVDPPPIGGDPIKPPKK